MNAIVLVGLSWEQRFKVLIYMYNNGKVYYIHVF